jgi:hypothetical protein
MLREALEVATPNDRLRSLKVPYPRGVVINRRMSYIVVPGAVALRGWCAYDSLGLGYALDINTARAVHRASVLRAREED